MNTCTCICIFLAINWYLQCILTLPYTHYIIQLGHSSYEYKKAISTVTFCFDLLFMQAIDMYTGNFPRQFTTKLEHSKLSILWGILCCFFYLHIVYKWWRMPVIFVYWMESDCKIVYVYFVTCKFCIYFLLFYLI